MLALPRLHAIQFDLQSRGIEFATVTVVRTVAPTSATLGAQAIVEVPGVLHGWIGGGCSKGVVIASALQAIECGLPRLVRISNQETAAPAGVEQHAMPCASNGTVEFFIQPVTVRPGLAVLGGTPTADEVRFQAEHLGINVGDDPSRAPIVLVATQGEGDEEALAAALGSGASHVLMIASATKAARLRERMLDRGITSQRLACLQSPVGPSIGASTPAEIALAAVAEVVRLRRAAAAVQRVPTPPVARPSDRYVNPVCGAEIRPEMVIHRLVHDGIEQRFCCDHCRVEFLRDPDKYTAVSRQRAEVAA